MTADEFPEVPQHVIEAVDRALEPHIPTLPTTRQVVAGRIAYAVAEKRHEYRKGREPLNWGDRKVIVIGLTIETSLTEKAAWEVVNVADNALRAEQ